MMQTNNVHSAPPSKELILWIADNKNNLSDISSSSDSNISTEASVDAIDIPESLITDLKIDDYFFDDERLRFFESFNLETKKISASGAASFHSNHSSLAEQSKHDDNIDDDNCCCGFIYKK